MSVWLVARWEYLVRVRSKLFMFSTFLMPVLIVGTVFIPLLLVQQEDLSSITYTVIGGSDKISKEFDRYLAETYRTPENRSLYLRYPIPLQDRDEQERLADLLLREGIVAACLLLDVDFAQSGKVIFHARVPERRLVEEQLRRALQTVWSRTLLERQPVEPEIREALQREIQWRSDPRISAMDDLTDEVRIWLVPILHVLILFFAIFLASQMLMRSIITERSNRVIEILLSSITPKNLMTGKILGLGLVGLTQLAFYLLVAFAIGRFGGMAIFGPDRLAYFLVYAILGYFFFAAIFAALGSMFETEQEAQQVAGLFSLIPILPLIFSVYVMSRPDDMLIRIVSLIPLLTPFLMIIRIAISEVPWWEIAATIVVLASFTVLMMRWAGSIFRATILHPGRAISLAMIRRWLLRS
jgi:ABC-2 type transport system permease protein